MEKGLAIIERTGDRTTSVFIDQEVLEYARLNLRTKNRVEAIKKEAGAVSRQQKKAELAKAKRKAYTAKTFGCAVFEMGVIVGILAAARAALISPILAYPVSLICLCIACVRLGMWCGGRK